MSPVGPSLVESGGNVLFLGEKKNEVKHCAKKASRAPPQQARTVHYLTALNQSLVHKLSITVVALGRDARWSQADMSKLKTLRGARTRPCEIVHVTNLRLSSTKTMRKTLTEVTRFKTPLREKGFFL